MKKNSAETYVHWSRHKEQAAGYWQLKFLLLLFKIMPVFILRVLAFPVGFFYFIFSKRGRKESKRYLQKVAPYIKEKKLAKKCRSRFGPLRHIISFSLALVEKLMSWGGKFPFENIEFNEDDINELRRELEKGKGVFLIFSHLGNTEMLRGLLTAGQTGVSRKIPVTAIMDIKVTAHFSRMLRELNPQSSMDIIGADDINPRTAILLQEKLNSGGMVVIAGDRTSSNTDGKNHRFPFFGKQAPFSSGVFYMAALMNAPVFFVFGLRKKTLSLKAQYSMHVHKSSLSFDCSRKERFERSELLAHSFAFFLENYCKEKPFQWYNFFDFWQEGAVK